MKKVSKEIKDKLKKYSLNNEWAIIKDTDKYLISYSKGKVGDACRLNIWWNTKNNLFTIGTYLKHPKQGKTQMFRKRVSIIELEKFFIDPRYHSGKGYKTKKPSFKVTKKKKVKKKKAKIFVSPNKKSKIYEEIIKQGMLIF